MINQSIMNATRLLQPETVLEKYFRKFDSINLLYLTLHRIEVMKQTGIQLSLNMLKSK